MTTVRHGLRLKRSSAGGRQSLGSGGAPMSVSAKADGGCSAEISTLNLVRAVQFVRGGRAR